MAKRWGEARAVKWVLCGVAAQAVACTGAAPTPSSEAGKLGAAAAVAPVLVMGKLPVGVQLSKPEGNLSIGACLSFSPDARQLVSGSGDGTLLVWDMDRGQVIQRFEKHTGLTSCAFLPDGKHIVSGDECGSVILWNAATGEESRRYLGLNVAQSVRALAVRPDGREVVVGTDYGRVMAWDLSTGRSTFDQQERRWITQVDAIWAVGYVDGNTIFGVGETGGRIWRSNGPQYISYQAASGVALPGGRLALGGESEVIIVNLDDMRRTMLVRAAGIPKFEGGVYGLVADGSGRVLLTADRKGGVHVWNADSRELRCSLSVAEGISMVAIEPSGTHFVVSAADARLLEVRTADCAVVRRFGEPHGRVSAVGAGASVLLGDATGLVSMWSIGDWRLQGASHSHDGEVIGVVALQGSQWASMGSDLAVVASTSIAPIGRLRSGSRHQIIASPDGAGVIVADRGGDVRSFDTRGRGSGNIFNASNPLDAIALNPRKHEIVIGGRFERILKLAIPSGVELGRWPSEGKAHEGAFEGVTALAYHSNGRIVAQGGSAGSLFIRDADTGRVERRLIGLDENVSVTIFAGEHLWAGGFDRRLVRWSVASGSNPDLPPIDEGSIIWDLTITPDQKYLIAGLNDGRASVRALPDGALVAHLIPFGDGSWATVFADGRFMSGSGPHPTKDVAALGLRFEDPITRRVATLGDIALPMQFGGISTDRDPEGPARIHATLFSPRGRPTVRLDESWQIKAITESPTSLSTYEIDLLIDDPSAATHHLSASFEGGSSVTAEIRLPPDLRRGTPNRRALVIGNEDYSDTRTGKASGALKDADDIAAAFSSQASWKLVAGTNLQVEKNLKADASISMKDVVRGFFARAHQDETLLFYYAGHGMKDGSEGYLLPIDYTPAKPRDRLTATELWGWIEKSSAAQILVILDACRAGSFTFPESAGKQAEHGKRVAFLMASSADQGSMGSAQGGIMTRAFIEALGRYDKQDPYYHAVTLSRAYRYVFDVAPYQKPRLFGSLDTLNLAWPADPGATLKTTDLPVVTPQGGLLVQARLTDSRQGTAEGEPFGLGEDRVLLLKVKFTNDAALLRVRLTLLGGKLGPLEYYDSDLTRKGGVKAAEEKLIRVPLRGRPTGKYHIEVQPCSAEKDCKEETAVAFDAKL